MQSLFRVLGITYIIFLFCINFLHAQIITSFESNNLHVCQSAEFQIDIYNNESAILTSNLIALKLPCGIQYVPASIQGGMEADISDLNTPVFEFPNLAIDSTQHISFSLFAPCDLSICIDNGTIFFNEISYSHDEGTVETITDPYNVETAQLIITKIEDPVLDGFKGAMLTRKIYIRNTRIGRLDSFLFKDFSDEGITVNSNNGTNISTLDNELILKLDGTDFSQIGDGDAWFEFNEEIIIEEDIVVETCAYDLLTAVSKIEVSWGCGPDVCDKSKQNAVIDINVNYDFGPILSFNPVFNEPHCYCSEEPAVQGMDIINNGNYTEVYDVFLNINQAIDFGAIDPSSINVTINGDTINSELKLKSPKTFECFTGFDLNNGFQITIPWIYPGETAKIRWDNLFCNTDSCFSKPNDWNYGYHYYKDCAWPDDSYHDSNGNTYIQLHDDLIKVELMEADPYKLSAEIQDLVLKVESPVLDNWQGELNIHLELPCSMHVVDNDYSYGGKSPISIQIDTIDKIKVIDLRYELPLDESLNVLTLPTYYYDDDECWDLETLPKDSLITSCHPDSICQKPPPTFGQASNFEVFADASIIVEGSCQEKCLIKDCDDRIYYFEYPVSGYVFDTIPGYLDFEFDVYRTSLGLPDNDEDNFADSLGSVDISKIKLHRAIVGDTINFTLNGRVVTDIPDSSFSNIQIDFEINLDSFDIKLAPKLDLVFSNLINPTKGLVNISNNLKIIQFGSESPMFLNNISLKQNPTIDLESKSILYSYNLSILELSKLNPNFPKDFIFKEGDSIVFNSTFKIDYNIHSQSSNSYIHPRKHEFMFFEVHSKALLNNNPNYDIKTQFLCDCKKDTLEIYNTILDYEGTTNSIYPCHSIITKRYTFKYGIRPNTFPYEIRSPVLFKAIKMPKIVGLDIIDAELERYFSNGKVIYNQDGPKINFDSIIHINYPYSIGVFEGYYHYNLNFLDALEKGEFIETRFWFYYKLSECEFNLGQKSYNSTAVSYFVPKKIEFNLNRGSNFWGRSPNVELKLNNCNEINNSDVVTWDAEFLNYGFNSSVFAGPVHNAWIYPYSLSGLVKNFNIKNTQTGEIYTSNGNIFYLDSLLGTFADYEVKVPLQITATNTSCTEEAVTFRYGWNCEPYTDPLETPCEEFEVHCTALSPPGIIDMLPYEEEIEANLCDTLPYAEVQIFDAGLGSVYLLDIQASLPKGSYLIPGSSQMAWPSEDQNYLDVSDPVEVISGVYSWRLTDFQDILSKHGLPGVNAVPENTISLRYKTITDCNFTSGTQTIYSITAEKICGEPTNSVAKVSEDIHISGVTAPYSSLIGTSIVGEPGCQDQVTIAVDIHQNSSDIPQSQVYAQIPVGLSFLPGSCDSNYPICDPIIDGQHLTWIIPEDANDIQLYFDVAGFANLDCKTIILPIYATADVNATCTSTNETCAIQVVTGDKKIVLSLERPVYAFEDFTANPMEGNTDIVDLSIQVFNSGITNTEDIELSFYLDEDGNGQESTGDVHISDQDFSTIIEQDSSATLLVSGFQIEPEDLCKLMVSTNDDANCLCSDATRLLSMPVFFPTVEDITICSDELITIGRASSEGWSYKWQDSDHLDCDSCSTTLFSYSNSDFDPVTHTLVLEQLSEEGCALAFEYKITVQGQLRIWAADENICAGNESILMASEGSAYNWQGAGIIDPNIQIQVVQPSISSWYFVTITDHFGCIGMDSVFVMVNETPIADAGEDLSFCFGTQPNLSAFQEEGYSYLWSPGYPFINDPTLPNPMVLTNQDMVFTLQVSKADCFDEDQVSISFYDGLDLEISSDTSVCLGDTLSLSVSGGNQYQWAPLFTDMCQDSLCSNITISLDQSTSFQVYGQNEAGCKDTVYTNIEIIEDQIFDQQSIQICSGSAIDIFGESQNTAGIYCDTTLFDSGCRYIQCIDLMVADTIQTNDLAQVCAGSSIIFDGQEIFDAGTYCLNLTNNSGCDSVHCLTVELLDLPTLSIDPETAEIQQGESIQLSASGNANDYQWSPSEGLDCSDCPDPNASPIENITYTIVATDDNGCTRSDTIHINVLDACNIGEILIPNAFTPDGNGKNDRFRIVNLNPEMGNIRIQVYNRWGQQLFDEEGNEGWDGTHLSEAAPTDVYIYVILISCNGEDDQLLKGDITLIR